MCRSSIRSCYMTMVSHWDIFIIVFFVAYIARFSIFKTKLFFFRNNYIFIEVLFNYFFNFLFFFVLLINYLSIYKQLQDLYNICRVYYICHHTDILFCNYNHKPYALDKRQFFFVLFFYWYSYTLKNRHQ